jgi:hypothetical protein
MGTRIEPPYEPVEQGDSTVVNESWSHRLELLIYSTSAVAGTTLALGYALRRRWVYAVAALLLAGWSALIEPSTVAARRRPGRSVTARPLTRASTTVVRLVANMAGIVLAGFAVLVAWGLLQNVSAPLMIVALAAALASWDLHYFRRRLAEAAHVVAPRPIVGAHLRRLALVVGGGSGLGLLALFVRIRYGMGMVVLLSVLALVGLSRAVAYVRRASD